MAAQFLLKIQKTVNERAFSEATLVTRIFEGFILDDMYFADMRFGMKFLRRTSASSFWSQLYWPFNTGVHIIAKAFLSENIPE
ncbi:unnamed protein product [Ilex paraguariensis]|uniref:Uncharacterized protein n=1 Tax=Ilex paraguariensis TaxID=185542 RepID=A0ABC8QPP0_9AQUA